MNEQCGPSWKQGEEQQTGNPSEQNSHEGKGSRDREGREGGRALNRWLGERRWKRREADRWRTERSGVSDISNSLRLFIFNQEFAAATICILALFALEEHLISARGQALELCRCSGSCSCLHELCPRARGLSPLEQGKEQRCPGTHLTSGMEGKERELRWPLSLLWAVLGRCWGWSAPPAFPSPGCTFESLPEQLPPQHGEEAVN